MLITTITRRNRNRRRRLSRTHLLVPHPPTNTPTPNLEFGRRRNIPHLKLSRPKGIERRHILAHPAEGIGHVAIRMGAADGRVEVLDVDEGVAFVVEGAEARDRVPGRVAEDLGEGFDDAHEDVFAGDGGGLVPEVDGESGVGDVVAAGIGAGWAQGVAVISWVARIRDELGKRLTR